MFRGVLDGIEAGYYGGDKQDTFEIMNNDIGASGVSLMQNIDINDAERVNSQRADLSISVQNRTVYVQINKLNIQGDYTIFDNVKLGVCLCAYVPTGGIGHIPCEMSESGAYYIRGRQSVSGALKPAQ